VQLVTVEKQKTLRQALKDSEKRSKEMTEYEDKVHKLQQWMTDTKQLTLDAESRPTVTMADHSHMVKPGRFFLLLKFITIMSVLSVFFCSYITVKSV
jgi:hypothetical protein